MRFVASVGVLLLSALSIAGGEGPRYAEVLRLRADDFIDAPAEVRAFISEKGCLVPQPYDFVRAGSKPVNVIQGQFAELGQYDWAILCSRKAVSSIVVFWGGPARCPTSIGEAPDSVFFQGVEDGVQGFSRLLGVASSEAMRRTYERAKKAIPAVSHDAIDDEFVDKASKRHYCDSGRWRILEGSD